MFIAMASISLAEIQLNISQFPGSLGRNILYKGTWMKNMVVFANGDNEKTTVLAIAAHLRSQPSRSH